MSVPIIVGPTCFGEGSTDIIPFTFGVDTSLGGVGRVERVAQCLFHSRQLSGIDVAKI